MRDEEKIKILQEFFKALMKAYEEFDSALILDYLDDEEFEYSSYYSFDSLNKTEYIEYLNTRFELIKKTNAISEDFLVYKTNTKLPLLLSNQKAPGGGFICMDSSLNDKGRIKSLTVMPSGFFKFTSKDEEAFKAFIKKYK